MPVKALAQIGDQALGNYDAQIVLTQPKQCAPHRKEHKAASDQENEPVVVLRNSYVNEGTDKQRRRVAQARSSEPLPWAQHPLPRAGPPEDANTHKRVARHRVYLSIVLHRYV